MPAWSAKAAAIARFVFALLCVHDVVKPRLALATDVNPTATVSTIDSTIGALHSCFISSLRGARISPSPFTELFFLDQLPTSPEELLSLDVGVFCYTRLTSPYLSAYRSTESHLKADPIRSKSLGTPGTRPLDSDSLFIRAGHAASHSAHVAGHSEIMETAVRATFDPESTRDVLDVLGWGSQAPDLYRWSVDANHAQTQSFDKSNRAVKVIESQSRFHEYIVQSVSQIQTICKSSASTDHCLALIGIASHALQDLAYHRGMSSAQHSGLSFVRHANPDELPEGQGKAVFARAVNYTKWFIGVSRARIAPQRWSAIAQWKKPAGWSYANLAARVFNTQEDIGLATLARYWRESLAYRTGARSNDELDDAIRGMWDEAAVMAALDEAL